MLTEKVRQRTFLYDTKSPDCRDQHMRANAWEGMGKELKIKRKFYVSSRDVRIECPRLYPHHFRLSVRGPIQINGIILKAFEDRKYCPAVFLDVSHAFDKVWHPGLLLKPQQTLPQQYFTLLQSYLQHRYLKVSYKNATSRPVLMRSGVPQGSILGPFL